ncbi:SIMPL domain-containing protein [uncultured Sphingomonas sp.]|uniref:SIMPL domain-containing protein n=1 Tax=uncultured Sphingomonas sp. TaxID=158754 RepID=UPI0025D54392|nr:SIMPL domain-containing protein [uncultured Sphingomonas sp.]
MKSLLPIALIAVAAPAYAAEINTTPIAGTLLELSAEGTATRVPDMAVVGAGVVTQAGKADAALSANAQRMTATVAALKAAGIPARDIQTQSISLQPQYRYGENQPPVLTGYQASNRVSVTLRDVARTGAVIDALVAAGANQIDGPNLTIDKPETALDEACGKALATARARAELYAKGAGLSVRRIVRIAESEQAGPPVRPLAMSAMRKAEATPIEAGEQELSVTLNVTFELG